ncbi:MAG TPA: response regulator [Vicinamibacteria bacterium]|jgi:DNA-binding response OmpR family regulator
MARILVVDDEELVCDIVSRFFAQKGYTVLTADTSERAISILETTKVDAVLLDIHLPGPSGLEALRKIRASWPEIAVVMISGQQDEDVAKATLREGAFDYVVKPLDFDYLERTIYLKLADRLD